MTCWRPMIENKSENRRKSLIETHPELCKEWNYKRNGNLRPEDVTAGCNKKVWWLLPYDDLETGKHFDFEWEAIIKSRTSGTGCPFLAKANAQVWVGFNDLVTTHPELCKEWNYKRNGDLKPQNVTAGSGQKVWWLLPYDDPKTGKHFDFEWKAPIYSRTSGIGCPYLSGRQLWQGFNDLLTTHPELCKEWNYKRNGNLGPEDVMAGSRKKVWWLLSYDDPETGRHFDFEWKAAIVSRVNGKKCPYLSGQAAWGGFNDLATTHPELCKEWNYKKNGTLKPEDVTAGSQKKVWWKNPLNGDEYQRIIAYKAKKK